MTFPLVDMDGRVDIDELSVMPWSARPVSPWVIVEHAMTRPRACTATVHGFWTSEQDAAVYAAANYAGRCVTVTQVATTEPPA